MLGPPQFGKGSHYWFLQMGVPVTEAVAEGSALAFVLQPKESEV